MFRLYCAMLFMLFLPLTPASAQLVFDPDNGMAGWRERSALGSTDYTATAEGIAAEARGTASVIERTVKIDMARHPQVSWRWRVDALQPAADITDKTKDDMGASLIFVFGRPSVFNRPKTLIYVWANDAVTKGDILTSPRSDKVAYIVLRAGEAPLGTWQSETRDLAADFAASFGHAPPPFVRRLCLFTDGDQTGERGAAVYGAVSLDYASSGEAE